MALFTAQARDDRDSSVATGMMEESSMAMKVLRGKSKFRLKSHQPNPLDSKRHRKVYHI